MKDYGIGIYKKMFSRLLAKFVSRSLQGTGLGLYLSMNMIKGLDGNIWVGNNKNGQDTTFSFNLLSD